MRARRYQANERQMVAVSEDRPQRPQITCAYRRNSVLTLQEHCLGVHSMPRKAGPFETLQISITLPVQAIEMMKELEAAGLHGSSRGEIARKLILDQLTYLAGQGIVQVKKARE